MYWVAFHELNSCRSYGLAPGPIPYTAIMDYARAHGFSDEQTDTLLRHTRAMDQAYFDYNKKKQEKDKKPIGNKPGKSPLGQGVGKFR